MKRYLRGTEMQIVRFIDGIPQTDKKLNGYYELKKKQDRNGRFLQKYWALMAFTAFNIPHGTDMQINLDNASKEMLHEIIKSIRGVESISFAKMSEDEFKDHYSAVLDECSKIIGASPDVVIEELVGFF